MEATEETTDQGVREAIPVQPVVERVSAMPEAEIEGEASAAPEPSPVSEPELPVQEEEEVEEEDQLELLRPSTEPVKWLIGPPGDQKEFVQAPLGFFAKMEFYSVVGEAMEAAMSGPDGLSLDAILGGIPGMSRDLTAQDFQDADAIMVAIAKLAKYVPHLLIDCYCIWLAVPLEERAWFKKVALKPVEQGGLNDEEGMEILEIFIGQNAEAIEAFFTKQLPKILRAYGSLRRGKSRSSKRSKPTQRGIQKQ